MNKILNCSCSRTYVLCHNPPLPGSPDHALPVLNHDRTDHTHTHTHPPPHTHTHNGCWCIATVALRWRILPQKFQFYNDVQIKYQRLNEQYYSRVLVVLINMFSRAQKTLLFLSKNQDAKIFCDIRRFSTRTDRAQRPSPSGGGGGSRGWSTQKLFGVSLISRC